MVIQKGATTIM